MKKLLLITLIALTTIVARSQLQIGVGAYKTDLKRNAVVISLSYLRSLDSIYGDQQQFIPGKKSFLLITPVLDIRTGTQDAFSSINVKASGLIATFKTKTVAGLVTPDFNRTFSVFPVNIGVETNYFFNNINGIAEVGWMPYYQSYGRKSADWVKKTNIAFFMQAGYKFKIDSTGTNAVGGAKDESSESPQNAILRTKGSAGINTGQLLKINGLNIGIVGGADVWYDWLNGVFYHRIEATGRVYINGSQYIDFSYIRGSGSPNFNQGDQWGVGLTIQF